MPRIGNARANILVFLLIEERRELLRARDRINNVVINLKNKQTNKQINQSIKIFRKFVELLTKTLERLHFTLDSQRKPTLKKIYSPFLFIHLFLFAIYLFSVNTNNDDNGEN